MRGKKRSSGAGMLLAMAAMAAILGIWVFPGAEGDTSPSQCKDEKRLLVNACKPVIFGQNPSASCCERVRVTHVECVCPYVTPKIAALINVKRTVEQIERCGRTVPRNFKCGSITTPP